MNFQFEGSSLSNKVSTLYIYSREKIDLIHVMPVLQNLGLYVLDQLTTRIGNHEKTYGYIQSYRVRANDGTRMDEEKYKAHETQKTMGTSINA